MAYNTVLLKKLVHNLIEKAAGGTVTPGNLVVVNSSDAIVVHPTAEGTVAPVMFAIEDALQGKLITDTYASGDQMRAEICLPGDEVYAILTTSQTIIVGDKLVSTGDGTLQKASAESLVSTGEDAPHRLVAVATEAVTTTASTSRICVRVV